MSLLNFLFKEKKEGVDSLTPDTESSVTPLTEEAEADHAENFEPHIKKNDFDPDAKKDAGHYSDRAATHSALSPAVASVEGQDSSLTLDKIREVLAEIDQIVNEDKDEPAEEEDGDFTTVEMSLVQIAGLVPHAFKDVSSFGQSIQAFPVKFKDLYLQFFSGKVQTTVGRMVSAISEDWLVSDYEKYHSDEIDIPLHLVVGSVRPEELKRHTLAQARDNGLDEMPNLFSDNAAENPEGGSDLAGQIFAVDEDGSHGLGVAANPGFPAAPGESGASPFSQVSGAEEVDVPKLKPEELIVFEVESGESKQENKILSPLLGPAGGLGESDPQTDSPTGPTERAAIQAEPFPEDKAPPTEFRNLEDISAEAVEYSVSADLDVPEQTAEPALGEAPVVTSRSRIHGTCIGDLDIKVATAKELAERLPGLDAKLAARIVRFREKNGNFEKVEDLACVPGVGPSTYARITGDSWSEARDTLKRSIDALLGVDVMPDLAEVALRFSGLPGFEGCIFTHAEGHVLAACWNNQRQDVLAVVAPQVFKKVRPCVEQLELGDLNPVTLFVEDFSVTIMECGDVYFAAIHNADEFSHKQLNLVRLVGSELEQRMKCPIHAAS